MTADLGSLTILSTGAFLGALVSSFAGLAFAPVAGVLLITVLAPKTVVPVLMVCSIIVQVITLVYLRRSLLPGSIGPMLTGGAFGVPLAVALFQVIDARAFQVGFGLFLMCYALVMLVRPQGGLWATSRLRELSVGFLGGIVGGLTAMPGAVPVLYCDLRGVGKEAQRTTVQPFILAMQMLTLALLALSGELTATVGAAIIGTLPGLGMGIVVGLLLFGRVPDASFRRIVLLLLLVTGLGTAVREPTLGEDVRGVGQDTARYVSRTR